MAGLAGSLADNYLDRPTPYLPSPGANKFLAVVTLQVESASTAKYFEGGIYIYIYKYIWGGGEGSRDTVVHIE